MRDNVILFNKENTEFIKKKSNFAKSIIMSRYEYKRSNKKPWL